MDASMNGHGRVPHPHTMSTDTDDWTIREGRNFVMAQSRRPGSHKCLLCHREVKEYHLHIRSEMAEFIVRFALYSQAHPEQEWIHVPTFKTHTPRIHGGEWGGDFGKLQHWGLLEEQGGVRADGSSRVGYWRITQLGHQYALGRVAVPYTKVVLCGEVKDTIGPDKRINEVRNFQYDELMANM